MKNFIWVGGITVVLIALMVWGVKGSVSSGPTFDVGSVNPLDKVEGNASSTTVLVEYSDFECPACRSYYSVVKQLMVEFGDKGVVFVYRDFPLTTIHPNAEFAARAAQAAGKQGKFWQMHDLLFEKQSEWEKEANIEKMFDSYATLLGLSVDQFNTDFRSKEISDFVRVERLNALKLGLQGTPTFFLNGKQIQNPSSFEAFRALIQDAIKSKS